jgi:hypothetical protein
MKIDRFNEIVFDQMARCTTVLKTKGDEYALGSDRLEHFKDSASAQGINAKQALWGMASKHFVSLTGMCKAGTYSDALWDEKITDSINYLLLLRALIEEEDESNV